MILPICLYGLPVLRQVAQDIDKDYPKLNDLIKNMFETMYHSDGVGLAAPQIGLGIRLVVIDVDAVSETYPECEGVKLTLINPQIVSAEGQDVSCDEGCLSFPGIHERVSRKNSVTIRYYDEKFEEHTETFEGFVARAVQHEYDHLEGKVFIDHISPIRKQLIKGKLSNIMKGKVRCDYRVKAIR